MASFSKKTLYTVLLATFLLVAGGIGARAQRPNGSTWSSRATAGPSLRRYQAMAYKVAQRVTLRFGISAALVSSEPPADGTLPKTKNSVILLTFDSAITLPGGAALSITSLPLPGTDVGGSFTYTVEPDGVTLKAKENGAVLSNLRWYRVAPATGFGVQAFTRDFCTLQGDADNSGRVLAADYFYIKNCLVNPHPPELVDPRCDLDGNGQVLAGDYFVVKNHMGSAKPPKPFPFVMSGDHFCYNGSPVFLHILCYQPLEPCEGLFDQIHEARVQDDLR
jgi:hypothetical protein